MPFLKQKIALANLRLQSKGAYEVKPLKVTISSPSQETATESPVMKVETTERVEIKRRKSAIGNNVMKNYCRAFFNFGISSMVDPYLVCPEEGESLSPEVFKRILNSKKAKLNCIKTLRSLLLHDNRDSKEMRVFKIVFQRVCLVFLKFFCANWIFNSKVADKMKHLKYRGKMLRRVQNPQYFTYLEDFTKKEKQD